MTGPASGKLSAEPSRPAEPSASVAPLAGSTTGTGVAVRSGTVGAVAWASAGDPASTATPVLLLHGLTDSGECWAPVVRHLTSGGTSAGDTSAGDTSGGTVGDRLVVTVDARGHGATPLGDEPFTIAALARDALAVLRSVVGRPALVVGHSMGGLVAEEVALIAPELVLGLVLEDPAWAAATGSSVRGVPEFLAPFVSSFAGVGAEVLASGSRRDNPDWPADEHALWARSKTQVDPRLVHVTHDWAGRDWVESLAQVVCPVALVTGDPAHGGIVADAARTRAVELLGDRLVDVRVADAGHSVRRDDRDAFLAALDEAVARV